MIIRKKTRELSKKHVNRKLIFKLRRLAIVLIILTAIIGYDLIIKSINPFLAAAGVFTGYIIGALLGKFSNIHWHEETEKVISKWNKMTVTVLIIYLAFAFSKKWIFGHWIHGTTLTAFSLSLALGVLTGRILSMRKQIRGILRERGYLKSRDD